MVKILKSSIFLMMIMLFMVKVAMAQIALIPVKGEIEPSIYKFLKRAIADAEAEKPERIIFLIDTFGGELNTTFQIVELISSISIPTISLVDEKAVSAGTLIAMASRKIYMQSNSIMGDVAPITMGSGQPIMLGEKFQSPLRAKFRALAQKNGYPVKLSEAFVSTEKEIIEVEWQDGKKTVMDGVEYGDISEKRKKDIVNKKTLVAKGELLTMSEQEAVEFGFSSGTVHSPEELAKLLAGQDNISPEITRIEKTPAEEAFFFFMKYSWILMLAGLGGIYLEVKNPGFGFYGILAIIALAAFFIGQYLVELADYVDLLLLIIGLILLVVEVFILPGFGIFGALGIAFMLGALILMRQNFIIPEDVFQWELLSYNFQIVLYVFLGSLVFLILSFVLGSRMMIRSPLVFKKKLFESPNTSPSESSLGSTGSFNSPSPLDGEIGVAITTLSPSGKIEIAGKIHDAMIPNDYLAEGSEVRVIGKDGYLLVVEPVERV